MNPRTQRVVFGTAALGLAYGLGRDGAPPSLMDEGVAASLVREALALGVDTFDTAPAYGVSEERLGRALEGRATVWTKVGRERAGDLRATLPRELEASLERLRRPRVELLQWHNWTGALLEDRAFVDAWHALREDARVGALGATTYGRDDALRAVESGLFDVIQVEFNLLNRSVVDVIADAARERRVEIAVRSVLLQGALTDDARTLPRDESLVAAVARARDAAHARGLRLEQLALRAAFAEPSIRWVLVGIDHPAQLADCIEAANAATAADASLRELDLGGAPATDPRTWASR